MTTSAPQSEDWIHPYYGASKQLAHDMSAVASGIGRALGIGGKKMTYMGERNVQGTDPNATTRVKQGAYNNYNDAVDYLNSYMRQNEGYDVANDLHRGTTGVDVHKRKTTFGGADYEHKPWWKVNMNTGNRVLDDYTSNSRGLENWGWTDYANEQSGNFVKRYSNLSENFQNNMLNNALANYGDTGRENFVNANDATHYADAKLQLDNQLARGYLSNVGYQQALQKLNNQIATNKDNLAKLAKNKHDAWETDLKQAWAKSVMDSQTGLNDDAWIKYYNNYMNYDGNNMNNLFDKAHGATSDYANTFISDDLMNAALVDQSLYNPDQYIAWGAANQGAYNPFDYLQSRKRRMTWDNIGEA